MCSVLISHALVLSQASGDYPDLPIASRWGFMLAAGASRKCHGSRNLLHKLRTGCVMHDASYHAVLQISATQEAIFQLLSKMWFVLNYLPYLGKDNFLFLPRFSRDHPSLTTDCGIVTMQRQNPVRQASPQHQAAHKLCKNHPRKEKKPLLTVQSELSFKQFSSDYCALAVQ